MNSILKSAVVFGLGLLVSMSVTGQEPAKSTPPATDPKAAEMSEDVEILRRLLNKGVGLTSIQETKGVIKYSPNGSMYAETVLQSTVLAYDSARSRGYVSRNQEFDGIYLKGHGVAYTVLIPRSEGTPQPVHKMAVELGMTCQNCHKSNAVWNLLEQPGTAAKPKSDWEKAREELRGERDPIEVLREKTANLPDVCTPGHLTETITKVLLANGKHLRHLTADESVTVVITLEGVSGGAHARNNSTMADPSLWTERGKTEQEVRLPGFSVGRSKQIALAELHLKQGKYAEAVKAFETALEGYADTLSIPMPTGQKWPEVKTSLEELQTSIRGYYSSLAQAYIKIGKLEEAKRALDQAQKLKVQIAEKKPDAGPAVPAKIILTAKKSHLDAAEKLSPVEFRKGISVTTVGLSATPKK